MESNSYDPKHEYGGLENELERLHKQLIISWEEETRLLQWLGLTDGLSVLELGCGPGLVVEKLVSLLPSSTITALDVDPEMLALAQHRLQDRAHSRMQFVQASVMNTGLPDNTYDFAIARYLFQHLTYPIEAAKEIQRVLKPGGKIAIIDVDAMLWGIVSPAYPQLQAIYAKTGQANRGGNRLIGRHLWRILKETGYKEPKLDAFVYHSDKLGLEPFLPQIHPNRYLRALHCNQITQEEFATVNALYQQFLESSHPYILMVGLIASGSKA